MKRKIYKLLSGSKQVLFALALTLVSGSAYSQTTYTFNFTGGIQPFNFQSGNYLIECWGADGGDGSYYSGASANLINGGKGGYSTGTINIAAPITGYVVVGGKGSNLLTGNNPGGYNGGGNSSSQAFVAGSGGGASHVATANGVLSSLSGNQAAVMIVAGGGGGGGNQSLGGDGGGLNGVQPPPITQFSNRIAGGGGTQTAGGVCNAIGGGIAGFGQGATTTQNLAGGGGGGWYGGGTGDNSTAGGGGSGYIGGMGSGTTVAAGQPGFVANPDVTAFGYVRITRLCAVDIQAAKNPICFGESVNLTTSAVSGVTWGHTASTATLVTVAPTSNTSYTVSGMAATGCTTQLVLTVTVNPLPVLSAVVIPSVLCVGNTATIIPAGGLSYTWTASSQVAPTTTVNPVVTSNINYTGINIYGCTTTTQVAVTVNTNSLGITPNSAVCAGNSIVLTANNAVTYTWSTGNNFQSTPVTPVTNTTYMASGTDIHNCVISNQVNITVEQKPNVTASAGKSTICKGESTTLNASGANTYTWSGSLGGGAQVTVNPPVDVVYSYTVTGTSANGCENTAVVAVTVSKCTGLSKTGGDVFNSRIYPNPTSGEVTVELNNGLINSIEVTDLTGRVIMNVDTKEEVVNLNLNKLSNGVYYFKVKSTEHVEIIKVVKSN